MTSTPQPFVTKPKKTAPGEARLNMSRQRITEACTVGSLGKLRQKALESLNQLSLEAREAADKREVGCFSEVEAILLVTWGDKYH